MSPAEAPSPTEPLSPAAPERNETRPVTGPPAGRRRPTRRLTGLTVAVLTAVIAPAAACTPQEDGTTLIEGDSLTWYWAMSGGNDAHATPGATIGTCPAGWDPGCVPPADHITAQLQAGHAAVVEIRLGTNDTADGWDHTDETAWETTLRSVIDQSEPDACVVLVLPWVTAPAPAWRAAEIDDARQWMTGLGLPTVDWRPYFEQPGSAGPDGIHQAVDESGPLPVLTPAAKTAFDASHNEALSACGRNP